MRKAIGEYKSAKEFASMYGFSQASVSLHMKQGWCAWPRQEKHGRRHTLMYKRWINMLQRCTNTRHPQHDSYGGRGIKVTGAWAVSFTQFCIDMGECPSNKHSIDRIDNNLGYSKDNCRWATSAEQGRNRRCHDSATVGVRPTKSGLSWTAGIKSKGKMIHLGTFGTKEEAIAARKAGELKHWS